MKLTNILYAIMGAACITLSACDPVDEADRLIYVKPAEVKRCVLLEEYTGQRCVNCPNAAAVIEQLKEQYGDNAVIAVGIHGGPLAVYPTDKVTGLRTATGDEYFAAVGSPDLPAGRIGRRGETCTRDLWQSAVYEYIQETTPLSLEVTCSYDEEGRKADIGITALGIEKAAGKLQIWLVEDGITAMQLMPDGKPNSEYVHNHVFRAAVNGTWGEDFGVAEGETKTVVRTAGIETAWKPENMSVVAFVYNDNGVIQATKCRMVQ